MMAILFQLERSQWWNPEQLLDRQFLQLSLLANHAYQTAPHYRQKLTKLGMVPEGPITPDQWLQIPILSRADVQSAGDGLFAKQIPKSHGSGHEVFTSGSTGKPIRVVRTQLFMNYWGAFTARDHLWHGRELTGKFAAIRESGKGKALYPKGSAGSRWGWATGLMFHTGPAVSLNITTPVEQQVEWLQREDPNYLLSHPTMLHALAEYCLENGVKLPGLRQVETISEILRPATREICREAWGVPVIDMYTTREVGYIALQCPEHEHYHIQSEATYVEVLDQFGKPCAPGQTGRVVVTPLHNFATPLLRYEVGDYAELGEPCPCGRGLPVIKNILGRKQNMLVMPSGEKRWPLLSSSNIAALLSIAPIKQYQFVQKSPDVIELRLAVERDLDETEEDGLRAWIHEKFGHPFEVNLSYHDEIPRTAAGKYHDFVSEVA